MVVKSDKTRNRASAKRTEDMALVQSALGGDEAAQREISQRLYNHVRVTVHYLTANHRDQEDFVQHAIVEVLRSLGSFRGDSSLETWGNRITVRKTMKLLKENRTRDHFFNSDNLYEDKGADESSIEQLFFLRQRLARVLGSISVKYRTVIVLSAVYGYSPDEIARILDAPRGTVRQRYRRGRKMLATKLARDPIFARWAGLEKK